MSHNLFVAYDLISPGQNYEAVRKQIMSLGSWYQLQYSLFYVHSSLNPKMAHDHIASVMDSNDKLTVINALSAIIHPLPHGDIDAINDVWFSGQDRALPYATAANR